MITGIIIALADEINSLTTYKINKGDCVFINERTLLAFSGAGSENASKACHLLINKGAQRLISWGCAAALNNSLKPGDLVLPRTLVAENQQQLSINSPWSDYVTEQLSQLKPYTGSLSESFIIVAKSSEKKTIHQQTGAIALDMESIAIAKTAKQYSLPVLVIRAIADPVTMDLSKAISYAFNKQGDIELTKLLSYVLAHPSEIPGLIKLGLHFSAAKNKLKLVANQLDTIVGFEQITVTE